MSLPPYPNTAFKFTEPANTSWSYGQKSDTSPEGKAWADGEKEGWKSVDPKTESPATINALMTSAIVPRPIAYVSSISEDGVENISPFSWFSMVSYDPPTISISCRNTPRVKDTTKNVKATKGFVVNIISEPWVNQAHLTSIDAPEGVSEWPVSGLTKEPSIHVKPPRVKESAFSMECELSQTIDIVDPATKKATTTLILGNVICIHVRKHVLNDKGTVDAGKLKPIGRMGDGVYTRTTEAFRLPKVSWKLQEHEINEAVKVLPN